MSQIKSILVAIDFSDCSKAALAQAVLIADWNRAKLHALHVIEPLVVSNVAWSMHSTESDAKDFARRHAHAKLTDWIQKAHGQAEVTVAVGAPIHEVLSKVRDVSADLLVAGARGSSAPIQGAGTLATQLARKAPLNVLLVSETGIVRFRKVVACVDFSPASGLAVEQAARVADREGGEIDCLHVFSPPWWKLHYHAPTPEASPDFEKQYTAALQGRLEEFVDQHEGFNIRCFLFPWSSYGQGIAQFAKEIKADLVVLGRRGHTTLRYILMGSTAERLLRELPCSVLAVRPHDEETILPIP